MTLTEVLEYYGNGYRFEKETRYAHTNIVHWRKKGYIPLKAQKKIAELTGGVLAIRLEDLGK